MIRACLILVLLLTAWPVHAQTEGDRTSARALFFDARDAFEAGEFDKAEELFARSHAIYPAPTAALGRARALVHAGRLVRAHESLRGAIDLGGAQPHVARGEVDVLIGHIDLPH